MELIGYVILQAEALKLVGLKGDGNDPRFCIIYTSREAAKDFLMRLLSQIKHEQSIGWRTKDNLNAQTSLDFLIEKVTLVVPEANMKARGWRLPNEPT